MTKISAQIPHELLEKIDDLADDMDNSRSKMIRDLIRKGLRFDDVIAEKDREIQSLEARVEELKDKLIYFEDRMEERDELVEFVESEKEIQSARKVRMQASVFDRIRWFFTGVSDDEFGNSD